MRLFLPVEAATLALGARLAGALRGGMAVFLHGDLGAGKTTLVRGLLRARGHAGPVKSPTYTIVESYLIDGSEIFHFDLYRLSDPEELEEAGLRDHFGGSAICLVEWPERGAGLLPPPDLTVTLSHAGEGREAVIGATTTAGEAALLIIDSN